MISTAERRVVLTGLGAVTDVGVDVPTLWKSVTEGRSGVGPITAFEQGPEWTVRIAGEASDWDSTGYIDPREARRMDRFSAMGVCAALDAA